MPQKDPYAAANGGTGGTFSNEALRIGWAKLTIASEFGHGRRMIPKSGRRFSEKIMRKAKI
jgi:hypothetical protein